MAKFKRNKLNNIIILSGFAAIALFMIIFTIIMITPVFTIDSYDDMKEITYAEALTQKKDSYYVAFVDENDANSEELEAAIAHYAEYARIGGGDKIYVVFTNKKENSSSTYKAPTLIYVSDGKASETFKSPATIMNKLNDLINK